MREVVGEAVIVVDEKEHVRFIRYGRALGAKYICCMGIFKSKLLRVSNFIL